MRLWTVHPCYLDAKGLVALWREALLAQKVLQGATRGYRKHPQLIRFRASSDPMASIAFYLLVVETEACARGYAFDRSLILSPPAAGEAPQIEETEGQLLLEWQHLQAKLAVRDPGRCRQANRLDCPEPHPLFTIVPGPARDWEKARLKPDGPVSTRR